MGGTCKLDEANVLTMNQGAIMGKDYCAMYLKLTMPVCDSCRYFEKRIEFYSNMATGCGDEFTLPPVEEEDNKDEKDKNNKDLKDGN